MSYQPADLASADDRRRLVDAVRATHGAINALVNNAGRAPRVRADLLDAGEDSFEELIRTNLQGPYFLTQADCPRPGGATRRPIPSFTAAIVFITSVSAEMASVNRGEYCVSKAGLSMAARLFAVRLAAQRHPGVRSPPRDHRDRHDGRASRRPTTSGSPTGWSPSAAGARRTTSAAIVAALLRGDAPYATGSIIDVDGGLSLPRL